MKIIKVIPSIIIILVLGFFVYSYKDSIKRYLGFATVYDAVADRAISNGWIISSNSYAWGENIGWVDFAPAEGATVVADNALWGYAYGENIGWVSLNCGNGEDCNVDYKVSNDGEGNLSGFAWGENVGWIDFGSTDIANRPWGVSINSSGDFTGYAYGENIGWISFNSANGGSVVYKVSTNWRPQSTRPQCNNGIDDDNDGGVDYPDDRQCSSLTDTRERSSGGGTTITTEYPDPEVVTQISTSTISTSTTATTTSQASTTTSPTIVSPIVNPPVTHPTVVPVVTTPDGELFKFTGTFTRDLYMDLSGEDVKELQKFLNNNGFIVASNGFGSVGNETTYYGNRTADAITKLQEANPESILTPYGLTKGTGYFGIKTRNFVNSRLNN